VELPPTTTSIAAPEMKQDRGDKGGSAAKRAGNVITVGARFQERRERERTKKRGHTELQEGG